MRQTRVIVTFAGAGTDDALRLVQAIDHAWPTPAGLPRAVARELGRAEIDDQDLRAAAWVVLARGMERPALVRLIDKLVEGRTPGVVVAPDWRALSEEFEPFGVVVLDDASEPAVVATVARSVVARQAALDQLASELRLAQASQGGLSGEVARLHEELQLAGHVQRRFLPASIPEIDGLDAGVLFRPCGYVSGDIYDLARVEDGRYAFMIADAVGHGVPAALLTFVISRALRHPDAEHAARTSPARALARLNDELVRENETGDRFATAVLGVIDPASGAVMLANAGHPPPLVLHDGALRQVTGGEGPLLGVFPDAQFGQSEFTLAQGETLLLYSDGFEVAFPGESPTRGAPQRHMDHLASLGAAVDRSGGVQAALEALAARVDEQAGSLHQRDDLTALALRRRGLRAARAA